MGGDTKAFRVAGTKGDSVGFRSLNDDGSHDTLYVSSTSDLRYYFTNAGGTATNKWSSLHIETHGVTANGTSSVTVTMDKGIYNYAARTIIAVCNGGAISNRQIISVIPSSSTTVTVNFDGSLPTSGTIFITFVYRIA